MYYYKYIVINKKIRNYESSVYKKMARNLNASINIMYEGIQLNMKV